MSYIETEERALKESKTKQEGIKSILNHNEKKEKNKDRRTTSQRIGSYILGKIFKNYYVDKLVEDSNENFVEDDKSQANLEHDENLSTPTKVKFDIPDSSERPIMNFNEKNRDFLSNIKNDNSNLKLLPSGQQTNIDYKKLLETTNKKYGAGVGATSKKKPQHAKSKTQTKLKLNFNDISMESRGGRLKMELYEDDENLVNQNPINKNPDREKRESKAKKDSIISKSSKGKKKPVVLGPLSKVIFDFHQKNTENLDKKNYHDTLLLELLHHKLFINSCFQAIISVVTIILAIGDYHDTLDLDPENERTTYLTTVFSMIFTILLLMLIIFEYWMRSEVVGIYYSMPTWIYRQKIDNVIFLVFRIIMNIFHPNPFLVKTRIKFYIPPYDSHVEYQLNNVFSVILMTRLYFIFQMVLYNSKFYKARIDRICRMNGLNLNVMFSFKALMIDQPMMSYPLLLSMFLLFGTFGMVVAESPIMKLNGVNFSSYWNAAWCMTITILTVGYGDFYARTTFGRIITILTALGGIFLFSMLIATLASLFSFTEPERQMCLLINRIQMMKDKEEMSMDVVTEFLKLKKLVSEIKSKDNINEKEENKYKELIDKAKTRLVNKNISLKNTLDEIKESYRVANEDNYFLEQTTLIEDDLELLKKKFNSLSLRFEKLELKDKESDNDGKSNKFASKRCTGNFNLVGNENLLSDPKFVISNQEKPDNSVLKTRTLINPSDKKDKARKKLVFSDSNIDEQLEDKDFDDIEEEQLPNNEENLNNNDVLSGERNNQSYDNANDNDNHDKGLHDNNDAEEDGDVVKNRSFLELDHNNDNDNSN